MIVLTCTRNSRYKPILGFFSKYSIKKYFKSVEGINYIFNSEFLQTYVRNLLTPLYEELEEPKPDDESWKINLRNLAKTFLCRAGYKPCIEEAQSMFKVWMDAPNPDEGNPYVIVHYYILISS